MLSQVEPNASQNTGQIVNGAEFFAPAASDLFDNLLAQYQRERSLVEQAAEFVNGPEVAQVMPLFIDGNTDRSRGIRLDTEKLFSLDGAVAALNSRYWQKALSMTDVLDYMPQKRRDDWHEQIHEMKAPDFDEETVRPTIMELLNMRSQFLAEKVDGMFRALSGEHVTNCPQAFGKRMIMFVRDSRIGIIEWKAEGHLNDLRAVIAKFMGRDEPRHGATRTVIEAAYRQVGEWLDVDGGALRIRVYLKGTAHLEVHPDMAWRLNAILATLYPSAIPASLRRKPVKRKKAGSWREIQTPLPFEVVGALSGMDEAVELRGGRGDGIRRIRNTRKFNYSLTDKHIKQQAGHVLELIGGVHNGEHWQFDYDPTEVIGEIVASGCVPDSKTHQFYPTPPELAAEAVSRAEITAGHTCLEPSAGTGNLAGLMTGCNSLTVLEISELHCKVLESKGLRPLNCDFLRWQSDTGFDRIVMNPPYSQGRWQRHLEHAAGMLRPGGRLVAILPESARTAVELPGLSLSWSDVHRNKFKGASVSVLILVADRVVQ